MREPARVAFFRVEGALASRTAADAAAWLALRSHAVEQKLLGLAAAQAARAWAGIGAVAATRLCFSVTRGMSADRLHVLSALYAGELAADISAGPGARLMSEARERGESVVWLSELPDGMVRPAAERLGVTDVLCNRLEVRGERSTGRIEEPLVQGYLGGPALRAWCAERAYDLAAAAAFGSRSADQTLLSAVGRPCAVRPDHGLRRVAAMLGWPVVDA
jgi:phosphoserine phosphatase